MTSKFHTVTIYAPVALQTVSLLHAYINIFVFHGFRHEGRRLPK